jgi:ubiquitin-protein ligase
MPSRKTRKQKGGTNIRRLRKNIMNAEALSRETASNLYYSIVEENLDKGFAMIIGPRYSDMKDSEKLAAKYPYEECLFFFQITIPSDYPTIPPVFKHLTPRIYRSRLHPNLYDSSAYEDSDGKVCLGILGTWGNNDWNSSLTLSVVLQGIMGILEANPGTYEPGCTMYRNTDERGKAYNQQAFYRSVLITSKVYKKVIDTLPGIKEGAFEYDKTNEGLVFSFKEEDILREGVSNFIVPFLEPLARRAYSGLSFLIHKVEEFIQLSGGPKVSIPYTIHHDSMMADFGALKSSMEATKAMIPKPLQKNVFQYGIAEIWRALYELSKPKKNGRNMTYEEFADEQEKRLEREAEIEKAKKAAETGASCAAAGKGNNNDYEYVYENEDE